MSGGSEEDPRAVTIVVPSDEAAQPEDKEPVSQRPTLANPPEDQHAHLSDEDRQLKDKLDALVEQVLSENPTSLAETLDQIRTEIRTSTSTMTSVPKPLKFLRHYYADLAEVFARVTESPAREFLADILSVLAMTVVLDDPNVSLSFRLQGSADPLSTWGTEYMRNLAGEISSEYATRLGTGEPVDDLFRLVDEILPYDMTHNAEAEACDLLLEVDRLNLLQQYVSEDNVDRVCLYLLGFSSYVADNEELEKVLMVAYDAYVKCGRLPEALRVALKLDNVELISSTFDAAAEDPVLQKQMGFILGAQKLVLDKFIDEDDDEMVELVGNARLHSHFLSLARDLGVEEPKAVEDVYKSHLADQAHSRRGLGGNVDSAKENLASSFVNAFVNCGFSNDLLMSGKDSQWAYRNKDEGKLSAVASLGLLYLWDLDSGFSVSDMYSYHEQTLFKAGALLATGMVSSGVTSEMDAAFALLMEQTESEDLHVRLSTIMGLGVAYAGSNREDLLELLNPLVTDSDNSLVSGMAALALGMVFVGQCNDDVCGAILEVLMTSPVSGAALNYLCIGLGLLYLGKGEAAEAISEALKVVEEGPVRTRAELLVEMCAYCGTGNVLQIQKFMAVVGQCGPEEEDSDGGEWAAVVGIAAVAMGEDIGADMALRMFDAVLQYGQVSCRRAVPLALGLLHASHPQVTVVETLSKLTHDSDELVSQNAVFALGLLGAGTNNSRIALLLRNLAVYYGKEPNHLFLVRLAQGLLHLGKGLLTLSPHQSDGFLMTKVAVAGLLPTLFHFMEAKESKCFFI